MLLVLQGPVKLWHPAVSVQRRAQLRGATRGRAGSAECCGRGRAAFDRVHLRMLLQVRLVLEYCDKGCLREALDDGIFLMGEATTSASG